ncbi:DUF222 domain-containing protein [Candidatus Poriferisocius sp.]|uniref:HNH endonuclease signature motif containing protein n=1 Tax=Candidatus Poriferisocius sp. TaxID=3101276 RepID=UPI003B01AE2B
MQLILSTDRTRRKLEGLVAEMLVRLGELEGNDSVEEVCEQFGRGRYAARRQAKGTWLLKGLAATLDATAEGLVSVDHARLIGESNQRVSFTSAQEVEIIGLAITQDLDEFKKTVLHKEDLRRSGEAPTRGEQQRRRKAVVFNGDDDMVILRAELDSVSGERVKTALDDLCDRMFRDDFQAGRDRTHKQRYADALVNLITQTPGNETSTSDDQSDPVPQATTLLVKVDYDTLKGQLKDAGLIGGTPISVDELRHIACDAGVVPAIFNSDGMPLYLGRKQRAASQTQKLGLHARDQRCVGCRLRATACEVHHILWWEQGGTTNIDNLVLLCPSCHTKIHKHGRHRPQRPAPTQTSTPYPCFKALIASAL